MGPYLDGEGLGGACPGGRLLAIEIDTETSSLNPDFSTVRRQLHSIHDHLIDEVVIVPLNPIIILSYEVQGARQARMTA